MFSPLALVFALALPTQAADPDPGFEAAALERQDQAILMLEEMLAAGRVQGEARLDMMLRLAELVHDKGKAAHRAEMKAHIAQVDACAEAPGCNIDMVVPDHSVSQRHWRRSKRLFQAVLATDPNHKSADQAAYHLGALALDLQDREGAERAFRAVVRTYADSRYSGEAWLHLGELAFEEGNAMAALQAYKRAAARLDGHLAAHAMRQQSWALFNLDEARAAQAVAERVLEGALADGQSGGPSVDEALGDVARFALDSGELEGAEALLVRHGRLGLRTQLWEQAAKLRLEAGQLDGAVSAYRRLQTTQPDSVDTVRWQHEVVEATRNAGQPQATMVETERLAQMMAPASTWSRTHGQQPEARTQAEGWLESDLRTLATRQHETCRKLRAGASAEEACQRADRAYSHWLRAFSDHSRATDVRTLRAEMYYETRRYDLALADYSRALSDAPAGKQAQFCAEGAVHAAEKLPTDTPAQVDRRLAAYTQLLTHFPEHKDANGAAYRAGYLLYEHGRLVQASGFFRDVIARDPSSPDAERAAHLILDALAQQKEWTALATTAESFLGHEGLGHARFRREVHAIAANAVFKRIEAHVPLPADDPGAPALRAAAEEWLAYVDRYPQSEAAQTAWNNAAVSLHAAQERARALEVRQAFVAAHPQSPFAGQHVAAIGFGLEQIGDFAGASDWYERLLRDHPDHPSAREARYSAALFRWALGQPESTRTHYQAFLSAYPDDPRGPGIALDLARLHLEQGRPGPAIRTAQSVVERTDAHTTPDHRFAALDLVVQATATDPTQHARAQQALLDAWTAHGGKPGAVPVGWTAVGQVLLHRAQQAIAQAQTKDVPGPHGQVRAAEWDRITTGQLAARMRAVGTAEQAVLGVVQHAAAAPARDALAALGALYVDTAQTLRTSPVPPYLTPEQQELYQMALDDRAYVTEEKAMATWRTALAQSWAHGLHDAQASGLQQQMSRLRPGEVQPVEESLPSPSFLAGTQRAPAAER